MLYPRIALSIIFLFFTWVIFCQTNPHHVWVRGHYRNGTYVEGYYRTSPNHTNVDNFSTKGNINPYTGVAGYIAPDIGVNPWKSSAPSEEYKTPVAIDKLSSYSNEPSYTPLSNFNETALSSTTVSLPKMAYAKGDQINVRQSATTSSRIEFRINKGDQLKILDKTELSSYIPGFGSEYWYHIECKGLTGWVFGTLIIKKENQIENPKSSAGNIYFVNRNIINVRSDPSIDDGIIKFKLVKDTEVEIIGKTQNTYSVNGLGEDYWYYIKHHDKQGWVFGKLIENRQ